MVAVQTISPYQVVMRKRLALGVLLVPALASAQEQLPTRSQSAVRGWVEAWLPEFLIETRVFEVRLWQWLAIVLLVGVSLGVGYLIERLALSSAKRVAKLTRFAWDDALVGAGRGPLRLLAMSLLFAVVSRTLSLSATAQGHGDVIARSVAIASVAWFGLRFVKLLAQWIEARVEEENPQDAGRVRGLRTQLTVLRHVIDVAVIVIASALILMQFEVVRSVGVSLLASAGIAGLVLGLAAQKSIGSLLAGIQLSITQPVRIGDVVIVENEWGWVEEVTLTYLVVKVWDLRRLVVPISYFLDRPFQNWSKVAPDLLGTVEIHADYSADVEAFRTELKRILENEGKHLFDGKAQGIQVTHCTERTMTIRALVSSADSGKGWDLRCLVREKLLAFLAQHPQWLPIVRNDATVTTQPMPADPTRNTIVPNKQEKRLA